MMEQAFQQIDRMLEELEYALDDMTEYMDNFDLGIQEAEKQLAEIKYIARRLKERE